MDKHPRAIAYDDDIWWSESQMSGSAGYVSSDKPDPAPSLLVPDGHGGYREHQVVPKPRRRLGFV